MGEKLEGLMGKGHGFVAIRRQSAGIPHLYSDEDVGLFWWGWFVRVLGVSTHQRVQIA
jgi:hypothetical protein